VTFVGKDGVRTPEQSFFKSEISAISCIPFVASRKFTKFFVVSFWHTNTIKIFSPAGPNKLVEVCQTHALAAPVRCLLPFNFGGSNEGKDYHPHVLAGLANGSVVSFAWEDKELKDMKVVSVGSVAPTLVPYQVEGKSAVFAAGLQAALFFWDQGRLCNSPVRLDGSAGACALSSGAFEGLVVVVSGQNGLRIGRVKDLNKMHIRSVSPHRMVLFPYLISPSFRSQWEC
jgi:DNA damage-binding protein 1